MVRRRRAAAKTSKEKSHASKLSGRRPAPVDFTRSSARTASTCQRADPYRRLECNAAIYPRPTSMNRRVIEGREAYQPRRQALDQFGGIPAPTEAIGRPSWRCSMRWQEGTRPAADGDGTVRPDVDGRMLPLGLLDRWDRTVASRGRQRERCIWRLRTFRFASEWDKRTICLCQLRGNGKPYL